MAILLVESDNLYCEMLRRLLKACLPDQVVHTAGGPDEARRLFDKTIGLLISRMYFPGHLGNRDFDSAAALFNDAREECGQELPIIAMTTSPLDDKASSELLADHGFPTDGVELFDLVATRPRHLVEKAAGLLGIEAHLSNLSPSLR